MTAFRFVFPIGGVLELHGGEFTHQGNGVFIEREAPGLLEGNLLLKTKSS